ncbi:MAG: hypothetical protein ACOZAN_00530 [Patescibacteria group bacterium]
MSHPERSCGSERDTTYDSQQILISRFLDQLRKVGCLPEWLIVARDSKNVFLVVESLEIDKLDFLEVFHAFRYELILSIWSHADTKGLVRNLFIQLSRYDQLNGVETLCFGEGWLVCSNGVISGEMSSSSPESENKTASAEL